MSLIPRRMGQTHGPCLTHRPPGGRQIHWHVCNMCHELIKAIKSLEQERSSGTVDEACAGVEGGSRSAARTHRARWAAHGLRKKDLARALALLPVLRGLRTRPAPHPFSTLLGPWRLTSVHVLWLPVWEAGPKESSRGTPEGRGQGGAEEGRLLAPSLLRPGLALPESLF